MVSAFCVESKVLFVTIQNLRLWKIFAASRRRRSVETRTAPNSLRHENLGTDGTFIYFHAHLKRGTFRLLRGFPVSGGCIEAKHFVAAVGTLPHSSQETA
jgi:hypothetical protein